MEDIARGALTGIAIGGFAAAVVKINMFAVDKLSLMNILGGVVCEMRSSLRENWQDLIINPYADEYIDLDKDINSWIEVAGGKLDKLRAKLNTPS